MAWNQPNYSKKKIAQRGRSRVPTHRYGRVALVATAVALVLAAIVFFATLRGNRKEEIGNGKEVTKSKRIADAGRSFSQDSRDLQIGIDVDTPIEQGNAVEEPKTNQWGNPAHWGHKKLRPAMVHEIDRSQLPLFERVFLNSADKTIAGLLVIEPGTDLIGDETFDESFVKAFLKSIEQPVIVSKDDDEETKALKRAVIETKIDLKARLDAGEDIAKTLTDIRRELRELGAYREDIKRLIDEKSHDYTMSAEDMKDFVDAANVMLDERGAKPIVMPEFYYRQLELRNQKIRALKGE